MKWNQVKKDNDILNYHVSSYKQIDNCMIVK